MSESPPTGSPQGAPVAGPQAQLTHPALESAIDDFRRWFDSMMAANGEAVADREPGVDLATLLGHFVALRQEVNLQTRAVRAQQEQNAELVGKLGQAVEALSRPRPEPAAEDRQRPLLNTLVELHDALSLASKEIARTQEGLLPLLEDMAHEEPEGEEESSAPPTPSARSFWSRWLLSPTADAALRATNEEAQSAREALQRERERNQERAREVAEIAERVGTTLSSLIAGYGMGVDRVERALRKHGLEPIAAVGEPFDPERMEVLEAVPNTGRPAGEVVGEVRRGYLWNGRVFRFAQVRVARG